jgi:thiol-disulfide isomerase/thioredoxin
MSSMWKLSIAAVAIGAVVAAVALQRREAVAPFFPTDEAKVATDGSTPRAPLPCLVEFSAGDCGPCKTMEPILDGLARDYQGRPGRDHDIWKRNAQVKSTTSACTRRRTSTIGGQRAVSPRGFLLPR